MPPIALIQHFLDSLRSGLQAAQASLLLYSGADRTASARLFHSGDLQPVAELADTEAAMSLITGSINSGKAEIFPSRTPDAELICLPSVPRLDIPGERRSTQTQSINLWLAVQHGQPVKAQLPWLSAAAPLCAALYERIYWQTDALTGLPGRAEFERQIAALLAQRQDNDSSLALLLISPLHFEQINQQEGTTAADRLLQQMAAALSRSIRDSDLLFRYGGATFALPLQGLTEEATRATALQVLKRFNQEADTAAARLALTAGGRWVAPDTATDRYELVSSADRALRHSKLRGRGSVMLFTGTDIEPAAHQDPLEGIFTGDLDHDYRAMRLLWHAVGDIAAFPSAEALVQQGLAALCRGYGLSNAAFARRDAEDWQLVAAHAPPGDLPWQAWVEAAAAADHPVTLPDEEREMLLLPVRSSSAAGAAFWMIGQPGVFDSATRALLQGVLSHIALAYDEKSRLEQTLIDQRTENAQLRETVRRIQHRGGQTSYLFESPAMRDLLQRVETLAPTDETILITGESGTGKEVIARTVHEMSGRSGKVLITVDCTAIPPSLLEAELFGRVKGAYTSADSASEGYIAKANGGTLFLDEIGELPIDVQSKLLRFMQEREIRPVGSGNSLSVDVRVIAATNRRLEEEVAAGRFREDLFHRLNVLDLRIPPLRERQADIITLARHFVTSYAQLHRRQRTLTEAAENALLSYHWPGNVRELQHCMLRAVLLTNDKLIDAADLNLESGSARTAETARSSSAELARDIQQAESPAFAAAGDNVPNNAGPPAIAADLADPWTALRGQLAAELDAALGQTMQLPLGSWLADDLIAAAHELSEGNGKRAAGLLNLPETTFRRQQDRVQNERASGLAVRTESWETRMLPILAALLRTAPEPSRSAGSMLEQTRRVLLDLVRDALPDQLKPGAAYIGVTVPTYKRYLQQVEHDAA